MLRYRLRESLQIIQQYVLASQYVKRDFQVPNHRSEWPSLEIIFDKFFLASWPRHLTAIHCFSSFFNSILNIWKWLDTRNDLGFRSEYFITIRFLISSRYFCNSMISAAVWIQILEKVVVLPWIFRNLSLRPVHYLESRHYTTASWNVTIHQWMRSKLTYIHVQNLTIHEMRISIRLRAGRLHDTYGYLILDWRLLRNMIVAISVWRK